VTELDHQAVADFVAYEAGHGRRVRVLSDPDFGDWRSWPVLRSRPRPGDFAVQCCTHVYADGCTDRLVCHGAPAAAAERILADGMLRCAASVTGRAGSVLAAAGTGGEPADYFEHVMFAHGRCTAPEAVACSRVLGRDLTPADLAPGYPPAVRFYFRWDSLAGSEDARFDGVHPVKIHGTLRLDDLVAVVVHARQRRDLRHQINDLADRIIVLDLDQPSPEAWATAATDAALELG
jgi:hypothetical protein